MGAERVLEGWLVKDKKQNAGTRLLGNQTRRWFRVTKIEQSQRKGGEKLALCYYKNQRETEPRGWMFMHDVTEVREVSATSFVVEHPSRSYVLHAPSTAEHSEWVSGLQELLKTGELSPKKPARDEKSAVVERKNVKDPALYEYDSVFNKRVSRLDEPKSPVPRRDRDDDEPNFEDLEGELDGILGAGGADGESPGSCGRQRKGRREQDDDDRRDKRTSPRPQREAFSHEPPRRDRDDEDDPRRSYDRRDDDRRGGYGDRRRFDDERSDGRRGDPPRDHRDEARYGDSRRYAADDDDRRRRRRDEPRRYGDEAARYQDGGEYARRRGAGDASPLGYATENARGGRRVAGGDSVDQRGRASPGLDEDAMRRAQSPNPSSRWSRDEVDQHHVRYSPVADRPRRAEKQHRSATSPTASQDRRDDFGDDDDLPRRDEDSPPRESAAQRAARERAEERVARKEKKPRKKHVDSDGEAEEDRAASASTKKQTPLTKGRRSPQGDHKSPLDSPLFDDEIDLGAEVTRIGPVDEDEGDFSRTRRRKKPAATGKDSGAATTTPSAASSENINRGGKFAEKNFATPEGEDRVSSATTAPSSAVMPDAPSKKKAASEVVKIAKRGAGGDELDIDFFDAKSKARKKPPSALARRLEEGGRRPSKTSSNGSSRKNSASSRGSSASAGSSKGGKRPDDSDDSDDVFNTIAAEKERLSRKYALEQSRQDSARAARDKLRQSNNQKEADGKHHSKHLDAHTRASAKAAGDHKENISSAKKRGAQLGGVVADANFLEDEWDDDDNKVVSPKPHASPMLSRTQARAGGVKADADFLDDWD